MAGSTCQIPVLTLRNAPFSISWGSSIYAQILATNSEGDSVISEIGNGAVIIADPDPPSNLREDETKRTPTALGLLWTSAFDGGTPILDYYLSMAQGDGQFTLFATSTATEFTVLSLTPGSTYQFKVQARNKRALSVYSNELSLLAAYKPEAPIIDTINDGANVLLDWTAPNDNGSPITSYTVYIQNSATEFVQESSCSAALETRICVVSLSYLQ